MMSECENVTTNGTYVSTFVALIVLLLLTIGATYIDSGDFSLVLALTISVMKALLIAAVFAPLRWITRGRFNL